MSLLQEAMEKYQIINKVVVDDTYGGYETTWIPGASFDGAVVFNNSNQMQVARAMGAKNVYTITVNRGFNLDYHMVIRNVKTGKIFRVTSNSDENQTPMSAGLNMRQYDIEEWEIPS